MSNTLDASDTRRGLSRVLSGQTAAGVRLAFSVGRDIFGIRDPFISATVNGLARQGMAGVGRKCTTSISNDLTEGQPLPNEDARARRMARKIGLVATKSRWRRDSIDNLCGFMLVDAERNWVVAGQRYNLTAEDVIEWCKEAEANE